MRKSPMAMASMNAHLTALEGKPLQSRRSIGFEFAKRGHEPAVCGTIEETRNNFRGRGKRKRVKILAMLDVLVHVFDDVLGKGGSQDAAVAESAMTELGASLEPGDNLVARQEVRGFREKLFFTRRIFVNNFAVIKNGLDLARGEARTKVKMMKRLPGGTAQTFASKKRGA